MDSKAYFEKVMQDFNQFRNGRSLRKYCTDEGIDYNWVIKFKKAYPGKYDEEESPAPLGFVPVTVKEESQRKEWQVHDMRNGREGLARIIREALGHNPLDYNEAYVFYSRDYRKVRILHYDVNGYVLYAKWFDDGKFLKPEFEESKRTHEISRDVLTLLLSTAVQTKIII